MDWEAIELAKSAKTKLRFFNIESRKMSVEYNGSNNTVATETSNYANKPVKKSFLNKLKGAFTRKGSSNNKHGSENTYGSNYYSNSENGNQLSYGNHNPYNNNFVGTEQAATPVKKSFWNKVKGTLSRKAPSNEFKGHPHAQLEGTYSKPKRYSTPVPTYASSVISNSGINLPSHYTINRSGPSGVVSNSGINIPRHLLGSYLLSRKGGKKRKTLRKRRNTTQRK